MTSGTRLVIGMVAGATAIVSFFWILAAVTDR